MAAQIITPEDWQLFKTELIREICEAISKTPARPRKWVKSYEVREMLGISAGTLQHMRANGTLSYTRIGGLIFYDYQDIAKLMDSNRKTIKRS
jgi:hypothetical protein